MGFDVANRRAQSTLALVLMVVVALVVFAAIISAAIYLRPFVPATGPSPGGSVSGSGKVATRELQFDNFRAIRVDSTFQAEITYSSVYKVAVTMDDNLFDYLMVTKEGEVLSVGLKPEYDYHYPLTLRAQIQLPDLNNVELDGATRSTISGFTLSHRFAVEISGASSAKIADTSAGAFEAEISGAGKLDGTLTVNGEARFTISGGGTATLAGRASDLRMEVSGGSTLELSEFMVHNALVNLSGGSRATINLDGRLDANISGASTLLYIGDPTMGEINVTGGSTLSKK